MSKNNMLTSQMGQNTGGHHPSKGVLRQRTPQIR